MRAVKPARSLRYLALAAAVALAASLSWAPSAVAVGDPVARGSFELALSKGFKRQLKRNGVKMSRRSFEIKRGKFDPTNGEAELTLQGKLKFRKQGRKQVFRRVTVTLGRKGALRGDGTRLFRLKGGSLDRDGFGARLSGVKAKLVRRAARRLNRKLRLRSLHAGRAGTAAVAEQPQTVRVTEGQTRVTPSIGSGNDVAFKLFAHCVNPLTGVHAIPPAVKHLDSTFDFPAQGGTIGPGGKAGVVLHAGGSQIDKDPLQDQGPCGAVPDATNIQQTDLQLDLEGNHVFGAAVINGLAPPLGGPKGVAIAFDVRTSAVSVESNPNAKRVQVRNMQLVLSEASATFLNLVFPNSSGDPQQNFRAGDLFGQATTTVRTR